MARPRRSQNTREALLDEGVRVLIEQGYHGTGIQQVVDRVNVPKGSFYNYFKSKEHFGAEVIRHHTGRLLARMDSILEAGEQDPLAVLRRYYSSGLATYEEDGTKDGCLLCNLGAELGGSSTLCGDAVSEAFQAEHRKLARVLVQGQAAGQVRNDISDDALAHALIDGWNGALVRMKSTQSVEPLRQFCDLYLDRFLRS